jgi:hypothetical protein
VWEEGNMPFVKECWISCSLHYKKRTAKLLNALEKYLSPISEYPFGRMSSFLQTINYVVF